MITRLKKLLKNLQYINTSGYNELVINDIVTEEQIKHSTAKTIVDFENKITNLEEQIAKNLQEVTNRNEFKRIKDKEFIPNFEELDKKMGIINKLLDCNIKVNNTIITKEQIENSKYNDITNIREKLADLKKKIDSVLSEIKKDLLDKKKEIDTANVTEGHLFCGELGLKINEKDITDCDFSNLSAIFNTIHVNYNLSMLKQDQVGIFFRKEFEKIENVYNFFVGLDDENVKKDELKKHKNNIDSVIKNNAKDTKKNVAGIKIAKKSLADLRSLLDELIVDYNEKYKKRYDNKVKINKKLIIELKYERKQSDGMGATEIREYYKKMIDERYKIENLEISDDII